MAESLSVREKNKVEDILALKIGDGNTKDGSSKYDLWKFFSGNVDYLKERMWSTGTWLITIKGALLAFMLKENIIKFRAAFPPLEVSVQPNPLAMTFDGFGSLFCIYSLFCLVLTVK